MESKRSDSEQNAFILIVDDVPKNLLVLGSILSSKGYHFTPACSGEQALKIIEKRPPDLILLDVMMPDMDGYEVSETLKESSETKEIPIIFLTARVEPEDIVKGFEAGGVDYITKPFNPTELLARIRTHLELRQARKELSKQNIILEKKIKERTKELYDSRVEVAHRLVFAAEYKDPETGSHIRRMSHYSALIARAYGLNEKECEQILIASSMHDLGKIGIPDNILLKPGKLEKDEWEIMKTHSNIGAKILANSNSTLIKAAQIIAISHHEKWNGSGYPQGLKKEAIPLIGRITAVADVFDALTSRRPYKEAWSIDKAVEEIKAGKESHFDPELVDKFLESLPEILNIKERFSDSEQSVSSVPAFQRGNEVKAKTA